MLNIKNSPNPSHLYLKSLLSLIWKHLRHICMTINSGIYYDFVLTFYFHAEVLCGLSLLSLMYCCHNCSWVHICNSPVLSRKPCFHIVTYRQSSYKLYSSCSAMFPESFKEEMWYVDLIEDWALRSFLFPGPWTLVYLCVDCHLTLNYTHLTLPTITLV